jgi:hypothetical protein
MSDSKPLSDAPGQQAAADARISKADARAERQAADPTEQAEADKAARAKAGVTGAENGDPAGVAFSARIAAAQFEHRNQGHDDTMQLIDDLFAAVQRLEARAAGGKGG